MIELEQLNGLGTHDFVAALAAIFEHSPWVAERVAGLRPFRSVIALHGAMSRVVLQADDRMQRALIAAHPELAGTSGASGLTAASTGEQRGAGLVGLTASLQTRIRSLNARYSERFGFPFILAVKGHTAESVIEVLAKRVLNDAPTERRQALREICRIAYFRLADQVREPQGNAIIAMAEALDASSDDPDGPAVDSTPMPRGVAFRIRDFMLAAGLATRVDAVGNVSGVMQGGGGRSRVSTGCPYSTGVRVSQSPDRLPIVLPIAVAAALRRAGTALPCTLEIVAFAAAPDPAQMDGFVRFPPLPKHPDGRLSAADAALAAGAFENFLLHYHVGASG